MEDKQAPSAFSLFPFRARMNDDDGQMCLKQGQTADAGIQSAAPPHPSTIFVDPDKAITIDIRSDLLSPLTACAENN